MNIYATRIMQGVAIVLLGSWVELRKEKLIQFNPYFLAIAGYALAILFTLCLRAVEEFFPVLKEFDQHFYSNNTPFIILSAVGLVLAFSSMKFHSKAVNKAASSVLMTYLIHDNAQFVNHVWFDIMQVQNHLTMIGPYMIVCAVLIFCACFVIDFILKHTIQPLIMKVLGRPVDYVSHKLVKLEVPF